MTYRLELLDVDGQKCALLVSESDGMIARAAVFKIQEPGKVVKVEPVKWYEGFWPKWR